MNCLLHFDFYGAGNVGDDLMLEGFVNTTPSEVDLTCLSAYKIETQRKRFSRAQWVAGTDLMLDSVYARADAWIGVGDTPIQVKGGDWFLNRLIADAKKAKDLNKAVFFAGVGAEEEALEKKDAFKIALEPVEKIWTRDAFSLEVIKTLLGNDPGRVKQGADLAHIALQSIFSDERPAQPKYEVGICFFDEHPESENVAAVGDAILFLLQQKKQVCFVANEVRRTKPFEYWLFRQLFSVWDRLKYRSNLTYHVPDYKVDTTNDLIAHYQNYEAVVTSRYHSLLAAAWAGCRVVALERSSKVSALANELGIPLIKKPFSQDQILEGIHDAVVVERSRLMKLSRLAQESVISLYTMLEDQMTIG